MTTAHVLDHEARALARLPQQHVGKVGIAALVVALVAPVQEIEDALWQLLTERTVYTATGATLDAIGRLVGELRAGQDDDDYRRFVVARLFVNRSGGRVEDLIRVADLILHDVDARIEIEDVYPAAVFMRITSAQIDDDVAATLTRFLRKAKAAGVRLNVLTQSVDDADIFRMDGTAPGKGYGDANDPTAGGRYSRATE